MEKISELGEILRGAKNILIGAGAGLSTAAGYTYDGERFQKYFADFGAAYGFEDMYSGGFYPYETPEDVARVENSYTGQALRRLGL